MRRPSLIGSATAGSRLKKARRLSAHLAFLDESGFLLLPSVRRTWAPCGQTPLLVHRYARDKLSAIPAVTVSPVRHCLGLYCHFHFTNLTQFEVAAFLRLLLRQLRGPILLLWDGGPIHHGPATAQILARHPRLMAERFPAYAPELNPDQQVWNHFKTQLANGCPLSTERLLDELSRVARRARRSSRLLRSFVMQSDLPPFLSPGVSITYARPNNAAEWDSIAAQRCGRPKMTNVPGCPLALRIADICGHH